MRTCRTALLIFSTVAMLAMASGDVAAQVRVGVGVGFGYGYGPYYGGYPYWGPWGYPFGPYGYYPYYDPYGSLRLIVTPRQAEVYIDGFKAGIVDNYDGTFQRLHIDPGGHQLALYLEGYKTVEQNVYLALSQTLTLKFAMEKLGPGETSGPRPTPPPPDYPSWAGQQNEGSGPPRRGGPPQAQGSLQAGPPQPMYGRGAPPPQQGAPPEQGRPMMPPREGTLALRVQPMDAQIWVDGELWQASQPREVRQIQLHEGIHKLEVKKEGFDPFTADVMVRPGQTSTVNVTLTKGDGSRKRELDPSP